MKFSVKILTIVMVQKTPFLITELILMAATAWNIGLVLLAVAPCIHTVAFMLMMYAVLCRKMQSQSAFCPHQAGKILAIFWPISSKSSFLQIKMWQKRLWFWSWRWGGYGWVALARGHFGKTSGPLCVRLNTFRWVLDSYGSSLRRWLVSIFSWKVAW